MSNQENHTENFDPKNLKHSMDKSIESLKNDLSGLRTGRASVKLVDRIIVDIYGSKMPINQLANISTPDTKTISINLWDKNNAQNVAKAITDSNLGLNPIIEGQIIRIQIPALSTERRNEIAKLAKNYGEKAKISVRNIRKKTIDLIKSQEKQSLISKDQMHDESDQVQKITDEYTKNIDKIIENKSKEILEF